MPALVNTSRPVWLDWAELCARCEALWVFFDADPAAFDADPLARLELFFARLELFLARAEPLDDDLALREPFDDERFDDERPRLVAPFAFARSLATGMFNLPESGLPAWRG
jgi:hypothetical protein